MASIVTSLGLLTLGRHGFHSTGYSASRYFQTMSVDDSATSLTAGTTTLGSPTNMFDAAFDSAPTETGTATIVCVMTIPTGSGNFNGKRFVEHNDTAANVTGTSATVCSGVDNQSLQKSSDFSEAITKHFTLTSV